MDDRRVNAYLALSIVAAILIVIIILLYGHSENNIRDFERIVFAAIFILCCALAVSFAIKPNWLKRLTHHGDNVLNETTAHKITRMRRGHHPDCKGFEAHIVRIKNRIICSGCLGLASGSVISIVLVLVSLNVLDVMPAYFLYIMIILGFVFIAANYIEIKFLERKAYVHIILSALLPISFCLVSRGLLELTGSIFFGFVGLLISFLWLDTRIQLSLWHHESICKNCKEKCNGGG
ncbi:MAG: hypothetical protein WC974_02785 [Thermoplasmata archaeon]